MSTNAQWVWRVTAVTESLEDCLDAGWEPFGVTTSVHGYFVYHLRRKVRT